MELLEYVDDLLVYDGLKFKQIIWELQGMKRKTNEERKKHR